MTRVDPDRAALRAAMLAARQEPGRDAQLRHMLAGGRPWREGAEFAAGCLERAAVRLRPWEDEPCSIDDVAAELGRPDDHHRRRTAAELVARMRAAGISKFHPDPLRALHAAETVAAIGEAVR